MGFNLSAAPVFILYECDGDLVIDWTEYPDNRFKNFWCFSGTAKKDLEHECC